MIYCFIRFKELKLSAGQDLLCSSRAESRGDNDKLGCIYSIQPFFEISILTSIFYRYGSDTPASCRLGCPIESLGRLDSAFSTMDPGRSIRPWLQENDPSASFHHPRIHAESRRRC